MIRNLTPGGYIELADTSFPVECDDNTMTADSALRKWANLMLEGTIKGGRPGNSAKDYPQQLEAAGFTNIVRKRYVWPLNRWPKDKTLKEIGTLMLPLKYNRSDSLSRYLVSREFQSFARRL
jgi:hypothetical protein